MSLNVELILGRCPKLEEKRQFFNSKAIEIFVKMENEFNDFEVVNTSGYKNNKIISVLKITHLTPTESNRKLEN